jgi:hypothetical protein
MRPSLVILGVCAIIALSCKTGPGAGGSPTPCEQLRYCACGADAGLSSFVCNAVDTYEEQENGEDTCRALLNTYRNQCGAMLQFRPSEAASPQLRPGLE